MSNLIKFLDANADGCGTEVSCLIEINAELTDKDKKQLQQIIKELKEKDACFLRSRLIRLSIQAR